MSAVKEETLQMKLQVCTHTQIHNLTQTSFLQQRGRFWKSQNHEIFKHTSILFSTALISAAGFYS